MQPTKVERGEWHSRLDELQLTSTALHAFDGRLDKNGPVFLLNLEAARFEKGLRSLTSHFTILHAFKMLQAAALQKLL